MYNHIAIFTYEYARDYQWIFTTCKYSDNRFVFSEMYIDQNDNQMLLRQDIAFFSNMGMWIK